jgi:hypothetical protein
MIGIPEATAIILTTAERTELEGMASRAIGRAVGCTTGTASKWRVRYAEKRFGGLDETGDRGRVEYYGWNHYYYCTK